VTHASYQEGRIVLSPPGNGGHLREKMTNRTIPMAPPGFPSPFEIPVPPGCEGWEEMYAYHTLFAGDRRSMDETRFWFQDGVHSPEPLHPFDCVWWDYGIAAFNQAASRFFVFPGSLGIEYRLLNGYVYASTNSITDQAEIDRRAELFMHRGGFYYEHWDELYERWIERVEATIGELESLTVPALPEFEDEAVVTGGQGIGSTYVLLASYDHLLEGLDRVLQYHFELVNLGYGAYLTFHQLCASLFPDITDQTVARMVSGIDLLVLRPDEELRRLARRALELGVGTAVKGASDEGALYTALEQTKTGIQWLADYERTKDPWFLYSNGNGLSHHHRSWIDDPTLPIAAIGSYIERLEAGEDISRPIERVLAERERITADYGSFLSDEDRGLFDESLALARSVFPFIENHSIYIEHRYFTLFWNKVREFGALLERYGYLVDQEDVFYLRHDEVREALEELRLTWSSAGAGIPRGPAHWPPIVARRKAIYEAMRGWAPPPALGQVPETITDPVTVMLWGITDERIQGWLSAGDDDSSLSGCAGSPGLVEGCARVILQADQLGQLEPGEILVAPTTSTSWTPVFGTIAGAVLDTGGIMSHAAIVAREYGLPAVVGTGVGTKRIKTGDRIRVDADAGVVTILS
jgi:pyruvate, water dikinase